MAGDWINGTWDVRMRERNEKLMDCIVMARKVLSFRPFSEHILVGRFVSTKHYCKYTVQYNRSKP